MQFEVIPSFKRDGKRMNMYKVIVKRSRQPSTICYVPISFLEKQKIEIITDDGSITESKINYRDANEVSMWLNTDIGREYLNIILPVFSAK